MFPVKDNLNLGGFPLITLAIIAANIAIYFLFQKGGILHGPQDATIVDYGAIPFEFTHPGQHCAMSAGQILCEGQTDVTGTAPGQPSTWLTAFSSMFMHASIIHLAGNMVFLWVFGNSLESALGKIKFVAFYLLAGLAALAAQIAIGPDTVAPTIGASGAIAGVLGGYMLLYPRARVLTVIFIVIFFTIIELPALLMLGIWFAQQIAFGYFDLTSPGGGGVAYFAHIGGFVFGLVMVRLFGSPKRRRQLDQTATATIS